MTKVQAWGLVCVEPGPRFQRLNHRHRHETLRHTGREQISLRPAIWFRGTEAYSTNTTGLVLPLTQPVRKRETISLKYLFAKAVLLQVPRMNYIHNERFGQQEKSPDKYATSACWRLATSPSELQCPTNCINLAKGAAFWHIVMDGSLDQYLKALRWWAFLGSERALPAG